MPATIRRRKFDLVLTEVPGGVEVSQAGFTYIARKWRLTPEVRAVIDVALEHGLQCLWQQGHPRSAFSHHISFAFDRSPSSWVFVIGGEAGPPTLRRVTFHKRLKGYFTTSGLGWVWDWETNGGKNILVSPDNVDSILSTLPLDDIRAGRLPTPTARGARRSQSRFFRHERDLEAELCLNYPSADRAGTTLHRQRPFVSNGGIEVASRPDVLLDDEQTVVIIELKLGEAGDAEFAQLERYLRNEDLVTTFPGRQRRGLLIADRFQPGITQRAAQRSDVTFMRYSQTSEGTLVLNVVLGDDVLAPYC